jgi:hypothetical protein
MVGWFDFGQLLHTGIKTVVSSAFGNYADKREMQAALGKGDGGQSFYDCSNITSELWVDYISDLGDGFDATFSVAHLLAQPTLEVDGHVLKRGQILVLGGDEVYPTPEMVEYNNRFRGPYEAAFPDAKRTLDEPQDPIDRGSEGKTPVASRAFPWLFAVPGNHDWYDGLTNFLRIFTQKRRIGNWQTVQRRSYFAIKLPHDYWIWGIDVQLDSDIDYPQCQYFEDIAGNHMANHSNIILCTAEPAWVYKAMQKKNTSYDRLDFFIRTYIDNERSRIGPRGVVRHHLLATFTGDLHHYSHYCRPDQPERGPNHLITAGGGGAFLHPTHNLPEVLPNLEEGPTGPAGKPEPSAKPQLSAVYPPKPTSRGLLSGALLFPFKSAQFMVLMGIFYAFFAWFAQSNTYVNPNGHVAKVAQAKDFVINDFFDLVKFYIIAEGSEAGFGFWHWLGQILGVWLLNPPILGLLLAVGFGLYKFTDTNGTKTKGVGLLGLVHGMVQLFCLFVIMWNFVKLNLTLFAALDIQGTGFEWLRSLIFAGEIFVGGGLAGAFIMGLYLYVSNLVFDIHLTESFSGLAIADYKNLLRIHFEADKVTIYPVGIPKATKNWRNVGTVDCPVFEGDPPETVLIETPIVIKR